MVLYQVRDMISGKVVGVRSPGDMTGGGENDNVSDWQLGQLAIWQNGVKDELWHWPNVLWILRSWSDVPANNLTRIFTCVCVHVSFEIKGHHGRPPSNRWFRHVQGIQSLHHGCPRQIWRCRHPTSSWSQSQRLVCTGKYSNTAVVCYSMQSIQLYPIIIRSKVTPKQIFDSA